MEISNSKITYAKNLTRQNFNLVINTPIDSNADIKRIININTYVYDKKIETASNKAIVSGKIGVKILYIDTDNIFNTLSDSQAFSETITDSSITSDSSLLLTNENIVCEVLSSERILKLNCSISFNPILYFNLSIPCLDDCDSMITKKSTIDSTSISNSVDTDFEYTCNLETKDNITKILCYQSHFVPNESIASEDSIIVSGNIYSTILYEVEEDGQSLLKEISATNLIKTDFPATHIKDDQILDLTYNIDQSKTNIMSEIEDNNSVVTISHCIKVNGVALQKTSMEFIDDMYSCSNMININFAERDFNKGIDCDTCEKFIYGETSIAESDLAIDSIISNSNINLEMVNTYTKNGNVIVEGIITSQLIYMDENHEYQLKNVELPFILDTGISKEFFETKKIDLSIKENKTKLKRGTLVEFEYCVLLSLSCYVSNKIRFVDNYTIEKPLDFSKYDYQIYLARENESLWELSKRICITPDELCTYNKNLPSVMTGNEKIIVKR